MKKQCILCSSVFEAKRVDANYCSEKCRAKANYEIRKKKASGEFSPSNSTDNSPITQPEKSVKPCKGEVDGVIKIAEIRQLIENSERAITDLCASNNTAKAQKSSLLAQKTQLNTQIIELEEVKIKKLEAMLRLSDIDLYNTYLNGDYQEAIKSNKPFPEFKLITANKLSLESSNGILFQIKKHQLKVENQILAHNSETSALKNSICQLVQEEKDLMDTINENNASIRFYQTRIIRLEQLLTG